MTVDPLRAAGSTTYQGTTYFFCNPGCLERFRANPTTYLTPTKSAAPAASAGAVWTCPTHPEIVRSAPGTCPDLALERLLLSTAAEGSPKMPLFNDTLTVQELLDLLAYLKALRPSPAPPGTEPIESMSRRHPGLTDGAPSRGIAASVGECAPQRSKARPTPHDTGRRPGCRVLADLRRGQGVGAGVARLLIVRGCDA